MRDLDQAIREAAGRHHPPEDWFDRIRERARRKRRNRRVLAGIVGLGLSLILFIALAEHLRTGDPARPGRHEPSPADGCGSGIRVSPTGRWRANGSGADAVGGHDAVLRGGATFAPGIGGQAFAFDGVDDFVEVPEDPALDVGTQDFTVSLWVRFGSAEGMQVLVQDWVETFDPSTSRGWTLTKLKGPGIGMALAGAGHVAASRLDLPVDTWIHVAARHKDGNLSIFVNGALARSRPVAGPQSALDSPASLKFGHQGSAQDTPGSLDERGFFLHGELDEIEIYVGRGLSDAQIRHIFETQSACAV